MAPNNNHAEPLNINELEHLIKALSHYLSTADYRANQEPGMTLDLIDRFATELADFRMAEMIDFGVIEKSDRVTPRDRH